MEVQEILSPFERNEGHFPKAAVMEAIARREEVIPALLEILEDVVPSHSPQTGTGWLTSTRCICWLSSGSPRLPAPRPDLFRAR
jgi:Protein of unknown function (DUF1186)